MDEFTWVPDWNARESANATINRAQFGDGYVQRQARGMNPFVIKWELSFANRDDDEISAIRAFLIAREGVTAFTWTPPGEEQAKFICTSFGRVKAGYQVGSFNMTFELVYEP